MARNVDQGADIMFIQQKFSELAAAAWSGFEHGGPGFLLIQSDNQNYFPANKNTFELKGSLINGTLNITYIPADALIASGAQYPTPNTEAMLDTYDADREILVVIQQQDATGWNGYRYVGSNKPSEFHRKLQDQIKLLPSSIEVGWCKKGNSITCVSYEFVPQSFL